MEDIIMEELDKIVKYNRELNQLAIEIRNMPSGKEKNDIIISILQQMVYKANKVMTSMMDLKMAMGYGDINSPGTLRRLAFSLYKTKERFEAEKCGKKDSKLICCIYSEMVYNATKDVEGELKRILPRMI